jgi:hypothetical protein
VLKFAETFVKSAHQYTLTARLLYWDLTRWASNVLAETALETEMEENE